jgi:peptide/nickel transport system permease protein
LGINKERAYDFQEGLPVQRLVSQNENWKEWFNFTRIFPTPFYYVLFADPNADAPEVINGLYQLRISGITFEEESDISTEFVMLGHVYGLAGTDYLRRDLSIPLFWGMPFALIVGLFGSLSTIVFSMVLAASGVWFGGWVDDLIQRFTEINLVLPILAISVLAYAYLGISIWAIFAIVIFLNVFGAPLKSFRSVLLQIREAPYIEAARAYGASGFRIIRMYLVPRIIPVLVPQLIILIPSFVFLEATLGLFNISTGLPTWGTTIYEASMNGALYGSKYWVLAPLSLLLVSGFAFSLCGSALEKILNPRLLDE